MFELGNSLREARSRQGLGYPQVELATKIRSKYIRALEEEEFDVLPAETYVKGFLRTYADFLGLDGQLYVEEYESRFISDGYDGVSAQHRSRSKERQRHRQRELSFQRRAIVFALVGITSLVALVIVAWRFGGTSPSAPSVIPPPTRKPAGLSFYGPGTYVEVRRGSSSGSVLYEGTLRAGETNLVLGNRFWILLRHRTHFHLTLNGKPVSLPARKTLKVIVTPTSTSLAD
jgi:Helix-turn-helix domain